MQKIEISFAGILPVSIRRHGLTVQVPKPCYRILYLQKHPDDSGHWSIVDVETVAKHQIRNWRTGIPVRQDKIPWGRIEDGYTFVYNLGGANV